MSLFEIPVYEDDVQAMLDKHNIKALVEAERYYRDNLHFEEMEKCYSVESRVRITWYDGDGRAFVRRSAGQGIGVKHKIHSTMIWLNGRRAIAEMQCTMMGRREMIDGIETDTKGYSRLLYKVEKESDDVWRIKGFDCIYERDWIESTAGLALPPDRCEASARDSYKYLDAQLKRLGLDVSRDLPGEDDLTTIAGLYEEADQWLRETAE